MVDEHAQRGEGFGRAEHMGVVEREDERPAAAAECVREPPKRDHRSGRVRR